MVHETRIGLLIEHTRTFGRELCEGIIAFAQDRSISLNFIDPIQTTKGKLADFDGFIARVTNPKLADCLSATGKPVVDVYYREPHDGFAIVKTRHESIGRLAAEHFLDRHFQNFAYCPYGGGRTSIYCHHAYVRRLKKDGFDCAVYANMPEPTYDFNPTEIILEHFTPPRDAKTLTHWLRRLPKPVALFTPSDLRAWQIVNLCRASGLSVPNDVAILGLDNDLVLCGTTRPMLSSIDPNTREIGHVAIEELLREIDKGRPTRPIVRQVEPTGVVARASTEIYPIDPPWLSDALVYIGRHARDGISAQDVFTQVGRSHTLVARTFRRKLDSTVQETIAQTRLQEARRLLKTTTLPVTEIAKLAGFKSTTYFLQSFTKAIGVSPGLWRAKIAQPKASRSHDLN